MIAFLTGRFVYKSPAMVHLEVGGVGYEVQISLHTYSKIHDFNEGTLLTWLQVKEDALVLFGFYEIAEKMMFLQLIGVNGVGAGTARMMLSAVQPEELSRAISTGDVRKLESIKGIGKKTAERIVLELKEKIFKIPSGTINSITSNNTFEQDALNALVALGIARNTAENAVKKAVASVPSTESLENLIKKSLQFI